MDMWGPAPNVRALRPAMTAANMPAAASAALAEPMQLARDLKAQIGRIIIGQNDMIERLLVALLANGHVLLEGAPGLAKTLALTTIANCVQAQFSRVQFTPDLLPADLIGTQIYNQKTGEFFVRRGPIFANIVLADEINRAPAKVQSALLEAMQEHQATIGDETFRLPEPFLVMATQNPLEHEGTYPLPEAQTDRFMLKVTVGYPNRAEEREILDRMARAEVKLDVTPVATLPAVIEARRAVDLVYLDDRLKQYIIDIVFATREPAEYGLDIGTLIDFGASPRATIYLALASKAFALVNGRGYVQPHDIKSIGMDVLRHRIITNYEAEAANVSPEDLLRIVFDRLPVP